MERWLVLYVRCCATGRLGSGFKQMKTLKIPLPDDLDLAAGASFDELEQFARTAFAVGLFAKGKATSGQAAMIAGMSRRRFLLELADHGVPAVLWDEEELLAERAALALEQ